MQINSLSDLRKAVEADTEGRWNALGVLDAVDRLTSATSPDVAGLIEDALRELDNVTAVTDQDSNCIGCAENLLRKAAAALRLSAGGGVPEGWKLVPVEPTPEMLGAFWRQKNCGTQEVGDRGPHTDDYSAYRAMLAASPTVEAGR